ncbi:MAG: hypothetical protein E7588_08440 [Ruminococcaceae bacterium]|nr:hypothetical protein [Oscillospiraceae bacterium]
MLLNENFMIGCNYWDSAHGTDMWRYFDAQTVENDFKNLKKTGSRFLRIFPNWRDFQPLHTQRQGGGGFNGYAFEDDTIPDNPYGLDEKMLQNFRTVCDLALKYDYKLVVAVITGWMSGRLFAPPAMENLNLITHPTALRMQERFITGFVNYIKDHPAICAWDLGNECNNLSPATTKDETFVWTAMVANTIRKCDNTRPVMSGMHGLSPNPNAPWNIYDQGALTDILCPHPYPGSPTIGAVYEPCNKLRTTMLPTIYNEYYEGISGKPAMMQETGGLSSMYHSFEVQGQHTRASMYSALANGSKGYLWWCAEDHLHLDQPPYSWIMMERSLGIMDHDQNVRDTGIAMNETASVLESLPFDTLAPKTVNTVVFATSNWHGKEWSQVTSGYILAKQAGLSPVIRSWYNDVPKAQVYILPSIYGWGPIRKKQMDDILSNVYEGATLYVSAADGVIADHERLLGLRAHGIEADGALHTATVTADGESLTIPFRYARKNNYKSIDAEVIGTDERGDIVFTRKAYGKGFIYFLTFPMEDAVYNMSGAFSYECKTKYYKIYREIGARALKDEPFISNNSQICVTLHPDGENGYIAIAINYSDIPQNTDFTLKDGFRLEVIHSSDKVIPACDAAFYRIKPI